MLGEPEINEVFRAAAHTRRRAALSCLSEYGELSLADLADEVATRTYETRIHELSRETVKRTYVQLYHVHIPALEDAGLVDYNQKRDLVSITAKGERIVTEIIRNVQLLDA